MHHYLRDHWIIISLFESAHLLYMRIIVHMHSIDILMKNPWMIRNFENLFIRFRNIVNQINLNLRIIISNNIYLPKPLELPWLSWSDFSSSAAPSAVLPKSDIQQVYRNQKRILSCAGLHVSSWIFPRIAIQSLAIFFLILTNFNKFMLKIVQFDRAAAAADFETFHNRRHRGRQRSMAELRIKSTGSRGL